MLITHRAASGAALARGLGEVLAVPPADPFAAEVVAVPAKGVERWLAQRLSHVLGTSSGDGVCANVDFPWPSTLVDEALTASSAAHADAVERWAPARSVWPLLEVMDAAVAAESWARTLARHLGADGEDTGRRLAVARRLAGMFDDYGQSRPEMLRTWAAGRDESGNGDRLDTDLRWQASSSSSAGLGEPRASRSRRHSSGCQRRSSSSRSPLPLSSRPAAQARSISGRDWP